MCHLSAWARRAKKNGDLELNYIEGVCREIGLAMRDKTERHTVVVRSTVLPGTAKNVVLPILQDCSGKQAGVDFGLAVNPEFFARKHRDQGLRLPAHDGDR